jgi:hypothetical protein
MEGHLIRATSGAGGWATAAAGAACRRPLRIARAMCLALVGAAVIAVAIPATAAAFTVTEGQAVGPTVVVGTFNEGCLDAMTCSELNPSVETITWGDGASSTPSACNVNTDTTGSSCWIKETCNPPSGCTFSLFAPGHVYAEEGTYTGSFFWNDPGGATLVTTPMTATVTAAALQNAAGRAISASAQQPFSGTVATFTDVAPGDHSGDLSGTIDWADGTPPIACGPTSSGDPCAITFASGVYSVAAGHTYARAGTYSATIVINDRGGTQTETHATVNVAGPPPAPPAPPPPPGPLTASVAGISTSGPAATVIVACAGPAGQKCLGSVTLSVTEHKRGSTVVAVSAAKRPKVHTTTATVSVGHGSFAVAVGQRATVGVTLSAAGRRLLASFYKLPVRLTLSEAGVPGQALTFTYPKIASMIAYTIEFSGRDSTVPAMSVTGIPKGGTVTLICRGGGCPFGTRTRRPRGSQISLSTVFSGARLAPRAKITIEVTAPNRVGKVLILTIESSARPVQTVRCLPPGARSPQVCA